MRIFNNYIACISAIFLTLITFSSCTESTMDGINNNNNYPLNVDAKFIVTELGMSTGFSVVGGDFSLYSSVYVEHETGIHNQMYYAETRLSEPISSTTYNNSWGATYTNIRNAKAVIKKCSPGGLEEGSDVTLGIAKVFLAYNGAILTDLFGDVPYAEAGETDENWLPVYPQPKVDKQEYIYQQVLKGLDEAIALFDQDGDGIADGEDNGIYGAVGNKDFIYGGDVELWLKAAYGLKARYTMRLLNKSSNVNSDLTKVLDYIDKSFTSADEEFKLAVYDGDNQVNPLASFSYSREALAASKSYVQKLKDRDDPRYKLAIANAATKIVADPLTQGEMASNGTAEQIQGKYNINATDYAWSAPTQLMSYHELLFLKAEAYARLLDTPNAKLALKDAIAAAFANLQISLESAGYKPDLSQTVSDTYFTSSVEALFDAAPLKEIIVQKYLAFMGASGESIEAYNDYRRMLGAGENFITLDNPKNTDKFPLRFVYGNSDVLANPNIGGIVGDGTYVYKEKVWWAGGTR